MKSWMSRGRRIWLLSALATITILCIPAATEPARDPLLLRAMEAVHLARALGDRLWPGFHLADIPLAVYRPGADAYLINHPSPPEGFTPVSLPFAGSDTIYYNPHTDLFDAATSMPINGVLTAVIPDGSMFEQLDTRHRSAEEIIGITFHEAFHVFESTWKIPPVNFMMYSRYPVDSAANNALGNLEGRLLAEALVATRPDDRQNRTRTFLAVRHERRRSLDSDLAAYESGTEILEGLAYYVEIHSLQLAGEIDRAPLPQLVAADPDFHRYAHVDTLFKERLDQLRKINLHGLNAQRRRFYVTGMAQAMLLDQIEPDWKTGYAAGARYLDDLLADKLIPEKRQIRALEKEVATTDARLVHHVQIEYNYPSLLNEEKTAAEEYKKQQKQKLVDFLNAPGRQLVLDVSALGWMGSWRMDPMNQEIITPEVKIHTRMLRIGYADQGIALDFQRPVLQDNNGKRYVTVVPAAELTVRGDGQPLDLDQDGSTTVNQELVIRGPGLNISAKASRIEIKGRTITVRFQPAG